MRLKTSLGALAGVAWMASATAVPRLDKVFETTCSSTAAEEATAVAPTSSSSSISSSGITLGHATTAISNSTCSNVASGGATGPWTRSSPIPKATTFSITPSTACFSATASALPGFLSANSSSLGLPSVHPGSNSSSCSSSVTASPVFLSPTSISAPLALTVTKVTALSTTTVSAAPATITLPVLSATTAESVVTLTISGDQGESTLFDSDATATVPSVPQSTGTVTVPEPLQTEATSILTLTFPDGPSQAATVLITITIPEVSITPGLWSTVATPQTITGTSVDEDVTVTVYTSSTSTILFEPKCSLSSAAATDGQQSWPEGSATTITVPAPPASTLFRPYALTYTLAPDSNLPTPFTGTITVTPFSPPANWAPFSSGARGSWQVDSIMESSTPLGTLPTPSSSGVPSPPDSTAPLASTSTYTVTLQDSLSAHTSIPTVTDSASTVSPTVIVTVLTPRPINPSTTVPFVPLTVTLTISDTATPLTNPLTNPTLFSPVTPASGQTGGSSSSPSNQRPDLATITVTTLASSSELPTDPNTTPSSSSGQPQFVTAASSALPSSSNHAPSPFGSEPSGYGLVSPGAGVTASTHDEEGGVVTGTQSVVASTQSSNASLSAPRGSESTVLATVTESPVSIMPTPSSPIISASAPFSDSTGSVALVTYTVPGQSGIGASTYTVTYTVHPSVTSAVSESQGDTSDSMPTQTSESPVLTRSSPEALSTVISTSRAPFSLTVTPSDTSGTVITITYTPGQPNTPASSISGPDESSISSAEPISVTPQPSDYGTIPSNPSDTGYGNPSDTTETSAELPVGATTSSAVGPTTTPNNFSTVVTVTKGTGSVLNAVTPTVTPSNSSTVFSGNSNPSTDWGEYPTDTTGSALPTSASSQPGVVTVTGGVPTAPVSPSVSTVVVSLVTLSQAVPLGYGSSTVVEFTTKVTVGFGSQTAPTSTLLTPPVNLPSSISVVFPSPSTSSVDEVSSEEPVSSSKSPIGSNGTSTRPAQPPVVVTIWPSLTSALSTTSGPAVTAQPGSTTQLASPSLVLTSTSTGDSEPISVPPSSCTEGASAVEAIGTSSSQPSISILSEVTIWPSPALDSSCSTLSTSYRPSNGSVVLSTSTAPLFSVTTLSPAPASSMLSGTGESSSCTETLSGASVPIITTILPSTVSQSETLSDFAPPPGTEFHHPAHAITDNSIALETSTFGSYDFSGSGRPAGIATAPLSSSLVTSVNSDMPVTQPQPPPSAPFEYGATPVVISESDNPNAISTPSISSAIEPDTTIVTRTEISSTTSSAVPVPIVTSLPSPDDLTSSVELLTPGPISTRLSSSAASLSTTLLATQSSASVISTAVSSSSHRPSTSTMLLSSVPHITFTFSPTPLPTTAKPSSSTAETSSSEAPLPPVIVTLTVTTTIISESVIKAGPATAPTATSSGSVAVSMLTMPSAASSAIVTSVTIPSITSSVGLTSVTAVPTISTSDLGPNATLPTSLPVASTPLLNSTALSSTALLITPTVTPPFLNSSTLVPTLSSSQAPVNVSTSGPTASATGTMLTVPTTTVSPSLFPNSTSATLHSDVPVTFFSITISATTWTMPLNSTVTPTVVSSAQSTRFPRSLPEACGAEGDRRAVEIDFDDIPELRVGHGADQSGPQRQPVPAPYHRLLFSDGFHVVSQADAKYQPSSGSQMVQHDCSSVAQFGLGQFRGNECFRFDFQGIDVGCDSADEACVFELTGLQWNGVEDVVQANATFEVSACPKPSSCALHHHGVDSAVSSTFTNLTAINITLVGPGASQAWWADDLQIAWTNNGCTAATCRARLPNTVAPLIHGPFAGSTKRLFRWAIRG